MDQIVENVHRYNDVNDVDSDPETNPEQLLNEWLGELDTLTVVSTWITTAKNEGIFKIIIRSNPILYII